MSLISGYLTIKAILYFKLLDVARVVLNSLNVNIHDSRTDGPIWSDSAVLSAQCSDSVSAVHPEYIEESDSWLRKAGFVNKVTG